MATSIDVAQYVCKKLGRVDAWKLASLTYYAQAWSLGWCGKPLCAEEFQAWEQGPVEPKLYAENRCGCNGMTTQFPSADLSRLTNEDIEIIDAVLDFYGEFTTEQLLDRVHSETPWLEARAGLSEGERGCNPVSQSAMRRFYAGEELRGIDVPCRPRIESERNTVETRERFKEAVERWETALEILVDK